MMPMVRPIVIPAVITVRSVSLRVEIVVVSLVDVRRLGWVAS
jgi:hypothetical protein